MRCKLGLIEDLFVHASDDRKVVPSMPSTPSHGSQQQASTSEAPAGEQQSKAALRRERHALQTKQKAEKAAGELKGSKACPSPSNMCMSTKAAHVLLS